MKLHIRTDADSNIGYGHLSRCLAIAEQWRQLTGQPPIFHLQPGSDSQTVAEQHMPWQTIDPAKPQKLIDSLTRDDLLLVDQYQITTETLDRYRAYTTVACMADAMDRDYYPVHMVVDGTPGAQTLNYRGLACTQWCLGAAYAVIPQRFMSLPTNHQTSNPDMPVIVTMGGADPDDATDHIARCWHQALSPQPLLLILGPGYQGRAERWTQRDPAIRTVRNPADLPTLFAQTPLAITAAGSTATELAFLGTDLLLVTLVDNQLFRAKAMAAHGYPSLGWWHQLTADQLANAVNTATSQPTGAGAKLIDGHGSRRIAPALLQTAQQRQAHHQPIRLTVTDAQTASIPTDTDARFIDAEVHLLPACMQDPEAQAPADEPILDAKFFQHPHGPLARSRAGLSPLLEQMDRLNIRQAVIMGLPARTETVCRQMNRYIHQCIRQYPDRLIGLGVAPSPHQVDLCRWIDEFRELGLIGLKVIPSWQHWHLIDPAFDPCCDKLVQHNMILMPHTDHAYLDPAQHDPPHALFQRARKHPALSIAAPHLGGNLALNAMHPSIRQVMDNILFLTSTPTTMPLLHAALEAVGPTQLAFATDYPFNPSHDQQTQIQQFHQLHWPDPIRRQIAHDNAERFFRNNR